MYRKYLILLWLLFHSINDVFWWTEALNFNIVQYFSFFFYGEPPFCLVYEIIAYSKVLRMFCVTFSKLYYFTFSI